MTILSTTLVTKPWKLSLPETKMMASPLAVFSTPQRQISHDPHRTSCSQSTRFKQLASTKAVPLQRYSAPVTMSIQITMLGVKVNSRFYAITKRPTSPKLSASTKQRSKMNIRSTYWLALTPKLALISTWWDALATSSCWGLASTSSSQVFTCHHSPESKQWALFRIPSSVSSFWPGLLSK